MDKEYNLREIIKNTIKTNWKSILLSNELDEEIDKIDEMLNKHFKIYDHHLKIFPPRELIFNAFNQFNIENCKVVILSLDPYIKKNKSGKPQAMGLCFSVPKGFKVPPSLRNIYKALKNNIDGFKIPNHGDISNWSNEGILMLNSALTVREGKSASHLKYWKKYTDYIIKYISDNFKQIVFYFMGQNITTKA